MRLPEAYLARIERQLGAAYADYLACMDAPPRRALRVNTRKLDAATFRRICPFPLTPTGLMPESFFFPEDEPIGREPLHAAGLCYAQEPSASVPATLLNAAPGMRVLDLCAAPGGKAGQIAAGLRGTGLLVANELVGARANTLCGNLERLGVTNAIVTSLRPDALCGALPGYFDAALVDAPCSGEGMFRREPQAAADWSPEGVRACAVRQRAILDAAADTVRPGGVLVYSTCTFSPEEDGETVEAFLTTHRDYSMQDERTLYPHTFPGEGQYMAVLRRAATAAESVPHAVTGAAEAVPEWEAFYAENLVPGALPQGETRRLPDGRVFLLPEGMPEALRKLRVLRAGLLLGETKNSRFVPAHALAMALQRDAFLRTVELGHAAGAYFGGETVPCDKALPGWCGVTYEGFPVGWGKAVGGTLKNHLPKGLRFRMHQPAAE